MARLDCMQSLVAGYIASPRGQEAIRSFLASPEGKQAIESYLNTPEGRQMARLILCHALECTDLDADVRERVLAAFEGGKKRDE